MKQERLNSCQARWALFFNRFNFHLSYRPGSKNLKPDTLSRIHCPDPASEDPDYILPRACVLGTVQWEVEQQVLQAQGQESYGCPPNRLHLSEGLRPAVLQRAPSCPLSCHPGAMRTLFCAQQRFWWLSMSRDVRECVASCPVCPPLLQGFD